MSQWTQESKKMKEGTGLPCLFPEERRKGGRDIRGKVRKNRFIFSFFYYFLFRNKRRRKIGFFRNKKT
jgi:hypothetical protein